MRRRPCQNRYGHLPKLTPEEVKTTWHDADGHVAKQSELAVGSRVVVKMNTDGMTAASVKLSAPAKK